MNYRQVTDRIAKLNITQETIAEAQGTTMNMVARARLDRSSADFRRPPPGWHDALVRLIRDRARDLTRLADEMERELAEHTDTSAKPRRRGRRSL